MVRNSIVENGVKEKVKTSSFSVSNLKGDHWENAVCIFIQKKKFLIEMGSYHHAVLHFEVSCLMIQFGWLSISTHIDL